jgi:pentatricopeptide repeat protein
VQRDVTHKLVLSLAVVALTALREHGPAPSAGLYRLLMRAAGLAGDADASLRLLYQFHVAGLVADARTANALLTSLPAASALEAYGQLQAAGAELDVASYNTLLRLALDVPSAKRSVAVQALLRDLRLRSLAPNAATLEAAVAALGSLGAADEAYALWQDWRAGGLQPCARGWAALLRALRDAGQHGRCEAVFTMLRGHTALNAWHYNIVADSLVRSGQPARALALARQMAADGVAADQVTRNTMLLAVSELRGADAAFAYAFAGRRDAVTWTTLTNIAADAGDFRLAMETVSNMRQAGFAPDVVTYTALMKAHAAVGDATAAVAVYRSMTREGVAAANASTFLTLLRACQAAGDAALASEMYVEMRRAGLRPSSAHFRAMVASSTSSEDIIAGSSLQSWLLESAVLSDGQLRIDLHSFSAAEARAAVLYTLRMLRGTAGVPRVAAHPCSLAIVTGRSRGRAPVLQAEVRRLCAELRLPCETHPTNAGRLIVPEPGLRKWLKQDCLISSA